MAYEPSSKSSIEGFSVSVQRCSRYTPQSSRQGLPWRELPSTFLASYLSLPLFNTVEGAGCPGNALLHTVLLLSCAELRIRIWETLDWIEQRMCIRPLTYSFIKGIHQQWCIVMAVGLKSSKPTVILIHDGTLVCIMDLEAGIMPELFHMGQAVLIRRIRMKVWFG